MWVACAVFEGHFSANPAYTVLYSKRVRFFTEVCKKQLLQYYYTSELADYSDQGTKERILAMRAN